MTTAEIQRSIIGFGGGGKGGGGGSTPTEAPDSLHSVSYARVVDLICEGEIKGLVDGLKSYYFNGTPVQNADGSYNFTGFSIDFRPGTQDQEHIAGIPGVENEIGVGVELTSATPYTRSITNTELSAVRVRLAIPSLSRADTSNGNINGYRVDYAIDLATDGGAYVQKVVGAFDGKTVNEYQRSIRVDLPPASTGWLLRVRRLTANANSATISDITRVASVTEIIDAKLRYPMSALFGVKIDAKQFQSIPTRSALMDLKIIRVPENYNPETRTYSGTWNGVFRWAWSNNPAWVYYDLVINDRFGLGHLVTAAQVDKWSLYEIAQYCDVQVPDGKGGSEPRFTCNCYLQVQAEAAKLLSDLVSVFRGISYWAGGMVVASCDMPRDPVYTYAPANVLGGQFVYSGSGRKTRSTVALVSWNDPADQYRAKVAYCDDRDGIARYGVRQISLTAFGCTSEAQAQRVGQWALLTSRLETGAVTFGVGMDGVIAAPGDIIAVADPHRAGKRMGGRIKSATGRAVVLDKAPDGLVAGDKLSVATPTGKLETQVIAVVAGASVTVVDDWAESPQGQAMWLAESELLKAQLFRVVSITQRARSQGDDGAGAGMSFDISAIAHEPSKYAMVDNGVAIDPRPISVLPPSVQPPPASVTLTSRAVIDQGIAGNVLTIAWEAAAHAVEYTVEWRKDSGEWIPMARTGSLSVEVPGIYAGLYLARVRSVSVLGVLSLPALSASTQLDGKTTPPPAPTSLITTSKVMGITLSWAFPTGAGDTQRTEIWYASTNNRASAIKLGDFAYPQHDHAMMGLASGVTLYFWVRLADRTGNIGGWFPASSTAGIAGSTSTDSTEILSYLAGQISNTQLATSLRDTIAASGVAVDAVSTSLASMYTIKTSLTVGGRLYMAGLGVGVENNDGVIESQVLVAADKFAIINTDSETLTSPFVVTGGNTYINQAFIGASWIQTANIEDEAVTNSKIQNLSVDSLKLQNQTVIVPLAGKQLSTVNAYVRGDTSRTVETDVISLLISLDDNFDTSTNPAAGVNVFMNSTLQVQSFDGGATGSLNIYRQINGGTRTQISFRDLAVGQGQTLEMGSTDMVFDQPGPGSIRYILTVKTVSSSSYPYADPTALAISRAKRSQLLLIGAKK